MFKIKIFIGLFYLLVVSSFIFFIFSNYSFQEISSYDFIKKNRDYFFNMKESNLLLLSIIFQKCCLKHILQDFHILQRPLINIDLLDETSDTSSGSRSQTISDVPNLLTQ